jgi:AraC family transcriptional regulator
MQDVCSTMEKFGRTKIDTILHCMQETSFHPHDFGRSVIPRVLFSGTLVSAADFRCRAGAGIETIERFSAAHHLVFTRAGTFRRGGAWASSVVDPTQVLFLGPGEECHVRHSVAAGHDCTTFAYSPEALATNAFQTTHLDQAMVSPEALLGYHALRAMALQQTQCPSAIHALEEEAIALLALLLEQRTQTGSAKHPRAFTRHRDMVEGIKSILAERPGDEHGLLDLAATFAVSPSQIAHVFRAVTGIPVHRYLLSLRMAAALEQLSGGQRDLSRLALDLGFTSHSHFTATFRKWFGMRPSAVRIRLLQPKSVRRAYQ